MDQTQIPKIDDMTLQDWFAGQIVPQIEPEQIVNLSKKLEIPIARVAARIAYDIADAMIEERALRANQSTGH